MIVVDVETTGIDPKKHSILSIGAIDFANSTNRFQIECSAFPGSEFEDEALQITGHSKESIFDPLKPSEAEAITKFIKWLETVDDHTVAGQNCYFDLEFVLAAAHRERLDISLPKRIVDLHSVTWAHLVEKGIAVPLVHKRSAINSDFICDYVGIPHEGAPHIGINGALWEAEAFSRIFYSKSLLPEFESHKIPWAK